jgi:hypothetical protein
MYVYCVYPAMSKKSENLSDLNKKNRNKRHSSPFINVVKGVFFNFIFIDNVRILYIYFHFVILTCSIYCIYFKNDFNIIEMSSYLWLNHDISVTSYK